MTDCWHEYTLNIADLNGKCVRCGHEAEWSDAIAYSRSRSTIEPVLRRLVEAAETAKRQRETQILQECHSWCTEDEVYSITGNDEVRNTLVVALADARKYLDGKGKDDADV